MHSNLDVRAGGIHCLLKISLMIADDMARSFGNAHLLWVALMFINHRTLLYVL